jgi:glycerophosphoryl diester phosphodiesterase
MPTRRDLLLTGAAATLAACASRPMTSAKRPIVIAHRGASGERPEHTLAAYQLAIDQGADFIEPDLVMTKDGVLVCRHENEIGSTTDVASRPEFRDRRVAKLIDGQPVAGWFTEDFTLAELKTLRAKERIPDLRPVNTAFDGQEPIPTFEEVLALTARAGESGRPVGAYPELKHPSYFAGVGLPMEQALVAALDRAGLNTAEGSVFIQCFEVGPLRTLRTLTPVKLIQLASHAGGPFDQPGRTYLEMVTPAGLAEVAAYAHGLGPEKTLIVPRDGDGGSLAPTRMLGDAHAAGLLVHPWTFRSENAFLPAELRRGAPSEKGDFSAEYLQFFALGVDGVFSDYPGDAARLAAAFAR